MKTKAIIVLLALGALAGMSAEQSPSNHNSGQEEVLIATLERMIVPESGTPKADVEVVYGEPDAVHARGKGSSDMFPTHSYTLVPSRDGTGDVSRASLGVSYTNGIVRRAWISHACVRMNRDAKPTPETAGLERGLVLQDLLEIDNSFKDKLAKATWNRIASEQSLPPVSGTRGTPAAYAPVAPGIPER